MKVAAERVAATPGRPGPTHEQRRRPDAPASPPPVHDLAGLPIQAKLSVSQPGDAFEQEADRVAAQVVSGAPVAVAQRVTSAPPVARQATEDDEEGETPLDESSLLSMKAAPGGGNAVTPSVAGNVLSLSGGGHPLDPATRSFMEPRFGHDFAHVRIHTDARAAGTAAALNARAFTLGRDVAFAAGEYRPDSPGGRLLLAHELAHVVQQGDGVRTVMRACACSTIGARNPTAPENTFLTSRFPRLVAGDWCVSAPATGSYNCIAWTVGNTGSWVWNDVDSVYGDKDGTVSVADFDAYYTAQGLRPVVGATPAAPKVVLYSKGSAPTHAAVKSPHPCGFAFESKLGANVRIVHDAYQLEGGSVYGDINRFYD